MGSPCLGFKSLDALSFYETVEIGTLGAVGESVLSDYCSDCPSLFFFLAFYRDFRGSEEGFQYFPKNTRCVKKCTCRRNNEYPESWLLQSAVSVTVGGRLMIMCC